MPLKHIVIASDFSKYAEYALQRAISLAERHHIPLHLIHVLQQPLPVDFGQYLSEQPKDFLSLEKDTLDELSALIMKYPTNISINLSVLAGRAADEITQYTEQNQANLIIAGAQGQYFIHEYVLGTTSSYLIEQGKTSVLLIKKEPSFSYKRILIATDFSKPSKNAIEFTFKCFPEAKFQLLHVVDIFNSQSLKGNSVGILESKTKNIMEQLDHFLKECDVKSDQFEKKIMGGYLADTIILQSKNWKADLLAFGAQGHSKLHYLMTGSVAKRLLQLSYIDMLVVPLA
ncbi:MAG: universal stress protein [Legionella longbeachae]|nr:universal stress protein [Legionella longbeachae]